MSKYVRGVLRVALSLRDVGSAFPLVVLASNLSTPLLRTLRRANLSVVEVPPVLAPPQYRQSRHTGTVRRSAPTIKPSAHGLAITRAPPSLIRVLTSAIASATSLHAPPYMHAHEHVHVEWGFIPVWCVHGLQWLEHGRFPPFQPRKTGQKPHE